MLKVGSETEFNNLGSNGNPILRNKPNHVMIGPAVFTLAKGSQRIKASTLAFRIIDRIVNGDDESSSGRVTNEGAAEESLARTDADFVAKRSGHNEVIDLLDSDAWGGGPTWDDDSDEGDAVTESITTSQKILLRPRGGAGGTDVTTEAYQDVGDIDDEQQGAGNADGSQAESNLTDTDDIEHLLAWLWACEKKMVTAPKLSDLIYDNTLVHKIRNIRAKLIPKDQNNTEPSSIASRDRGGLMMLDEDSRGLPGFRTDRIAAAQMNAEGLSNLASTTKDIADVLERMESNRRTEQRKKDSDKSFLSETSAPCKGSSSRKYAPMNLAKCLNTPDSKKA
jgi:hypothetical protein